MDIDSLKTRIRFLMFGMGFYFFPALVIHLLIIKELFLPSGNYLSPGENYVEVYNMLGSGGLGLLFIGFIGIFVSTIFVSNKVVEISGNSPEEINDEEKVSFIAISGVAISVNIVIAFILFGVMMGRVGGDLHEGDNNGYYVTYRGEVVKHITEKEYFEFFEYKVRVVTYLLSSVFLAFAGVPFLKLYELYKITLSDLNKKPPSI